MNHQVMSQLSDLKAYIDKRLDEIYSLVQAQANKPDLAPSNYGDCKNVPNQTNLLVDLLPSPTVAVRPQETTYKVDVPSQPPVACSADTSPLKYLTPEFNKYQIVNLSYVFSTRSFFVHLNYDEVENFYMRFNEFYNDKTTQNDLNIKPSKIVAGQLCCVFNDEDSSYYRALILKETEGKFLVRLIDFGDMKLITPKSVFTLYPEYIKVPVFALHCYLDDSWTTTFDHLETAFMDFISPENRFCSEVKAKFLPKTSQSLNKFPVSLIIRDDPGTVKELRDFHYEDVPVADCVSKYMFDYKAESTRTFLTTANYEGANEAYRKFSNAFPQYPLSTASTHTGVCCNVTDISSFIFLKNGAFEFTSNLSFFYRGFLEYLCTEIKPNSLVVFGVENKYFFRGFVVSTAPSVQLFAIDFGFLITSKENDIFPLFDNFSFEKFPTFSAKCALHNIVPILESWSPVAIKTFQTFVQGYFTIHPKKFSNGIHSVEVEMSNKNRAGEMLKKFKLGKDDYY